MKLIKLWLVVFALIGICLPAESVSKDRMSKTDYLTQAETQVKDWESKVLTLKTERDGLPATSPRFKNLDKNVSDMESEVKGAKEEIADLKTSTDPDWSSSRKKIDKKLANLQQEYNEARAE